MFCSSAFYDFISLSFMAVGRVSGKISRKSARQRDADAELAGREVQGETPTVNTVKCEHKRARR